jgi:hypothetical protein
MVLPVSGLPGGKKNKAKKGKKGKKGKDGMPGDVQVNLIVDPNAFGRPQDEDDDTDEDDEEGAIPGSFDPAAARRKRKRAKRRSVFAGLAMEEDWKRARSWVKKITAVDVLGIILWGATFIFILIGKRCPSGAFEGWSVYPFSLIASVLTVDPGVMRIMFPLPQRACCVSHSASAHFSTCRTWPIAEHLHGRVHDTDSSHILDFTY